VRKLFGIVLALALVLIFSIVATTPVVADNGTVYNQTQETYHATIQDAIAEAADGDTIHVYPGTYTGVVSINVPNLTLQAVDEDGIVIDATEHTADPLVTIDADGAAVAVWAVQWDHGTVIIEGFTVTNWHDGGIVVGRGGTTVHVLRNYVFPPEGVKTRQPIQVAGPSPQVIGNLVKAAYLDDPYWVATGILVNMAENALIQGNVVVSPNDLADVGIAVSNTSTGDTWGVYEVTGNVIHGNEVIGCRNGILIQAVGGDVENTTITDNELENNEIGLRFSDPHEEGYEITLTEVSSNTFTNNDIQVIDEDELDIDLESILDDNEFDRAVVVRDGLGGPIKVPTVFSRIEDALDAAEPGDTIEVKAGAYVGYDPLLDAEIAEASIHVGLDAKAGTDNVSAEATGGDDDTIVAVAEFVGNPTAVDPGFVVNDVFFFDVHVGGELPDELEVTASCPGGDCSGMILKWFDGTEWLDVSPAAVDDNGVFRFTLDDESSPTIAELTGTPFGLGNPTPPPPITVGWEGSPVNKAAVMAPWIGLFSAMMAGASLLVVRRRRARV